LAPLITAQTQPRSQFPDGTPHPPRVASAAGTDASATAHRAIRLVDHLEGRRTELADDLAGTGQTR